MERGEEQGKKAGSMPKRALAGVRVLEWAQFVAGPYCAKLMADNGAEVIKLEEPDIGDETRRRGPFLMDIPHPERSALFLYLNTNKLGVTLNLRTATGKEIFQKLIKEVDIFIEDNPPQVMKELGLDYESLQEVNPNLIMTSITPFGQTGPYKNYKCYYLNTFHGSGFGYLTPTDPFDPDVTKREPIMLGGFLAEYYSGVTASIATVAASFLKDMTGVGQHIDVSKQETQFIAPASSFAWYPKDGQILTRAHIADSPSWGGVMPCKDGYVNMLAPRPYQLAALYDVMGNPEWSKEERFNPETIHLHGVELRPFMRAWAAEQAKEEIWHAGQQRDIPLAAIYTVGEAMNSEHLKAREFFVEIDHPEAGKLSYPGAPCKFSETPARFERPAPLLGEHNKEIYCDRLGYSQQDLALMRGTGII